ncbi:replication protein [Candidatus Gracilibacteria bacterium]|nr:replication protein [Candidatus Gracilibacteria bacterium]
MANPQLENGYLRIANEIAQHLVKTPLLGAEFQILLFIVTKTYGFNKKKDWISLSQFEKGTGLSRPTVVKSLKNLVIKKLVYKSEKFEFWLNKDWEQWVVKTPLLVKYKDTTSKDTLTNIGKDTLTHKRHKTYTKDKPTFSKEKGLPLKTNKKDMKTINYDTQEEIEERPKSNKRDDVIKLALLFDKMATEELGVKITTPKSYFIVLNAINTHKLKPKGIEKIYQDWFANEKTKKEDKSKLSWCLGKDNINSFKVKYK